MRKTEGYVSSSQEPAPEFSQPNNQRITVRPKCHRRTVIRLIGRGARRIWVKTRLVQQHVFDSGVQTWITATFGSLLLLLLSSLCSASQFRASSLDVLFSLSELPGPDCQDDVMPPPSLCAPRRCFSVTVNQHALPSANLLSSAAFIIVFPSAVSAERQHGDGAKLDSLSLPNLNGELFPPASLILALDVTTSNLRPGMMAISLTASNVLYLVRLTVETLIGRSARSTVALSMPGLCIRACGIAPRLNIIDVS
ncbi:hypothetical protein B0H11DRAFT_2206841 [Mycena galericulata]|nr:hypothetical protein B0H11DRAFT_2206841 [Mycena galericulata]